MTDQMPEVLNVSTYYASSHIGELAAHVRERGGVVRIMDLSKGTETWMVGSPPAGVLADLTLERSRRKHDTSAARRGKRAAKAAG